MAIELVLVTNGIMVWWWPNHFLVTIWQHYIYNACKLLDGAYKFLVANKSRSLDQTWCRIMCTMVSEVGMGLVLGLWYVWIHYNTHLFFHFMYFLPYVWGLYFLWANQCHRFGRKWESFEGFLNSCC
jgi:hypothetical protein